MSSAAELKAQGSAAFAAKDYARAAELYSAALEAPDADAAQRHVLYSNRSASYAALKDWDRALEDGDKTIEANPTFGKGFARKGAALHGLGRLEEAVAAYEEGLKVAPGDAILQRGLDSVQSALASDNDAGMGIGKMFQDPQMWSKLEANPKTAALVRDPAFRAKLSAIQADPSKAASAFSDPNMIAVMGVLMGIDLQAFERPEGSSAMPGDAGAREEEAPKPAPKPTPKAPEPKPEPPKEEDSEEAQAKKAGDAAKARGNALYVKRDFAGASEQYKAAWEAHKDIVYLSNLAACQFETGAYDECIKTCEEALEHGSETRADYKIMAKAYARIGSANVKKEDLPTAIRFFQKSLTEHRTADTLAKLQAAEKQLKENERRAYIDPAKSEEERNRGNDLYKKGDFAGAVAAYTEAIKRAPEDSRGYTNRSSAYLKLMALSEALKDTDEAIKLAPKLAKPYIRKANVLLSMKQTTRALEQIQRASDAEDSSAHAREINELENKISRALYEERANETEEDVMRRAQSDPEVAGILADPVMRSILEQAQSNPAALQEHLRNPEIAMKIQKLVAAGVIKTGRR